MKKIKTEIILLTVIVLLFVAVRSINYLYYLNWSSDQATWGREILTMLKTKKLTLIGPRISINLQGRFVFQGPLIYYFFLLFLWLGHWDPAIASYLFTLWSALMVFPLYYGVKNLISKKTAWIAVIIYSFLPYYLEYTRFLWNTTLQLSLLPLLILFMGLYRQKKTWPYFLLVSIMTGILLQFHYQFAIVILGIFIYYFLVKRLHPKNILLFVSGLLIGFSPLILFELKHQFYNLQTIILFFRNWNTLDRPGGLVEPHYFLSITLMSLIAFLGLFAKWINKIRNSVLVFLAALLFVYSLLVHLPKPVHAYWAPTTPWNYLTEVKVYNLVRSTKLTKNFNVANTASYDTKYETLKYFLYRDGYQIDYDDYYRNRYLFVVTEGNNYQDATAYEVAFFKPRKILKGWPLNEKFQLLLLERLPSN